MILSLSSVITCLSCGSSDGVVEMDDPPTDDLVRTIADQSELSIFAALIDVSPVGGTLQAPVQLTVFAPTDAAFRALPAAQLDGMLTDPGLAGATVLSHVTSGLLTVDALENLSTFRNGNNADVTVDHSSGAPRIGGASLVRTDIRASNGILHIIDAVILP